MQSPSRSQQLIDLSENFGTHNYHPLPVVISRGEAEWLWDVEGRRYLDMLSAYSAVNQGHCHPQMLETLQKQAHRITLTSRAFYNDQMGPWLRELCNYCEKPRAIPMNTGAEAVETAIKLARKWGYLVKKVAHDQAEILVCTDNFHGRTTTLVGFSTEEQYKKDFGPFTPGFKIVQYGDVASLEKAIGPNTVGFLIEPIQGEAGVVLPPPGYLKRVAEVCKKNNVLLMADEIQTGLGRTGMRFACDLDGVVPDLYILGKALGGGMYPISAVVGDEAVLGLLQPGDHGSTFGGNPLACALSRTALQILIDEKLAERAHEQGLWFRSELKKRLPKELVQEVRGAGLLNAIELKPKTKLNGRDYSYKLMQAGLLAKDTHGTVIRFAPPLVIKRESLEIAVDTIVNTFEKSLIDN